MYTAKVDNFEAYNNILPLNGNETMWQVLDIQGLDHPAAQINMTHIVGADGAKFNSSYINVRNIVVNLKINGSAVHNRMRLEQFFATNKNVRFYYKTDSRDMYIDCIVERCTYDLYASREVMQVSMICPDPFFLDVAEETVDISNLQAEFEFPFAINSGSKIPFSVYKAGRSTTIEDTLSLESPVEITVDVFDQISGIIIQNLVTNEYIKITKTLNAGDQIYINTEPLQPIVQALTGGIIENAFSSLDPGSTLFQLNAVMDGNIFGYSVDNHAGDGKVRITMKYRKRYIGA